MSYRKWSLLHGWILTGFAALFFCNSVVLGAEGGGGSPGWLPEANNAFAVSLYSRLATGAEGNLFLSPTSIHIALAMTYAGARERTAQEMAWVLHLPADSPNLQRDFGDLLRELNGAEDTGGKARPFQLSIANALWGQKDSFFVPGYVKLLNDNYGAGFNEVDFKKSADDARMTINSWVEKQTQGKITDLIGQGVLTPLTRLVLTNAIYFKGKWRDPFEKSATQDAPFYLAGDSRRKVPMMRRTGTYGYLEEKNFQALRLPYAGNELSMIVLLPSKPATLATLESEMNPKKLADWISRLADQKVAVSLPRFTMTEKFELSRTLASLGMSDAFNANADFSGMDGKRDLMISKVIHKAFVDVSEEGTEAAAATGVVMTLKMAMPTRPPASFVADHPFLFLIRDDKSGAILFMGRLADPGQ